MNIESPAIPYNFADLEPVMSRDTLVFHFLRHQRVCFDRLRLLIRETELAELPLDELIRVTARDPAQHNIHRWAAEVWNHDLYWRSMRARGGGTPQGPVAEHIRRCFGTFEGFAREFKEAANAHFGSGWLWLVWRHDALHIVTTSNAGTPPLKLGSRENAACRMLFFAVFPAPFRRPDSPASPASYRRAIRADSTPFGIRRVARG